MNELESQENGIDTNTMKRFETNEQDMMIFDTVGNEIGDGGDSDGEGDEMLLLDYIRNKPFDDVIDCDLTEADVDASDEGAIPGAPKNWQPPQPPSDFKLFEPKFGAPLLERIDNTEKWSHYTCQQKYLKGKYLDHFTPVGTMVVPANENGERKFGDWEFYYNVYNANEVDLQNFVCVGANSQNSLPESTRVGAIEEAATDY